MIKILVTNKLSGQVQESLMPDMAAANAWIEECELKESWGRPFHVINHLEQVNFQEPLIIHHEEVITPNPDLVIHHDEVVTPVADLIIHHDEVITLVADLIIHHEEVRTPNPDLIVHHEEITDELGNVTPAWDESVPQLETIIPAWDEVIPQDPIITPAFDEVIPQPPIVTPAFDEIVPQAPTIVPAWDEFIPQPDIIIPAWTEEIEAEYTIEIVDITAEVNAKELQRKYDYLWKAANDFQSGQISGAAIGLLTIGVLAQKPKCTAVQAWIKSVWVEYYTRKAGVNLQNNVNLDFSICGNVPYTVPELMEEVSI